MKRFAAVILALMVATPIHAKNEIDPSAAYVLVDIGDLEDSMFRGVDIPGTITIARYSREDKDIRGGDLSPRTVLPGKASPHLSIYKNPVVKMKGMRQYLVKVDPDIWVIESIGGTSMSLGSMSFEVKAGQVVDLGFIKPRTDWAPGEEAPSPASALLGGILVGRTGSKNARPVYGEWHARTSNELPVPDTLQKLNVVAADYEDGATFGNYLGGLVNRFGGRAARLKALQREYGDAGQGQPANGE